MKLVYDQYHAVSVLADAITKGTTDEYKSSTRSYEEFFLI